jgi:hypothetical protein
MDIDANRRRGEIPPTCYRCGKAGHLRKDCPQRFDVRLLDADEREEIMMQWMADKDAVAAVTPSEDTGELRDETRERSEEDFVECSR